MAKIKVKKVEDKLNISLKLAFGESFSLQELSIFNNKTCYGLLFPEKFSFKKLSYKTFNGISISDYLETSITKMDIIRTIEQFLLVILEIKRLDLKIDNLLMDVRFSYIDLEKQEIKMLYSSLIKSQKMSSIREFIYQIISRFKTEKNSELDFRRRFIDFLDMNQELEVYQVEGFLINEKREFIRSIRNEYYNHIYAQSKGMRKSDLSNDSFFENENNDYRMCCVGNDDVPTEFLGSGGTIDTKLSDDDMPTEFYIGGDDTSTEFYAGDDDAPTEFYFDDDTATEFYAIENNTMSAEGHKIENMHRRKFVKVNIETEGSRRKVPIIIRKLTNETIYINKSIFRIGRAQGEVDYCVLDNRSVSRGHIDLILRDENCYVVDLQSKNRTFVNNRVIPPGVETKLHEGDVIKLGIEEFIFKLK